MDALCGRTVREGFRVDSSARGSLETIVAYGRRGRYGRLDVALVNQIALFRRVSPHAGETVGLEFEVHGKPVARRWILLLKSPHFWLDPEYLLYVMANFMGDHVSLRELTGGSESRAKFTEEAQIQVNFFIIRTVKRSHYDLRHAATRRIGIAKKHQLRVTISRVLLLWQHAIPIVLHIVQYKGHELNFGMFRVIPRRIDRAFGYLRGSA